MQAHKQLSSVKKKDFLEINNDATNSTDVLIKATIFLTSMNLIAPQEQPFHMNREIVFILLTRGGLNA